ncbi:hypothetical protein NQ315_015114 [Exocentrus adspersus]|uniref:Uncharacterized protein n=1 Tax=Exocentrus adspersus TaxID=1586481 RepID=A0AAV8VAK4_9CUCU|nr:hypothetical protein NQ315_015114 [Exocentrus adspersus]
MILYRTQFPSRCLVFKDIEKNVVLNQYIQQPVSFKGNVIENITRLLYTRKPTFLADNLEEDRHESWFN